MKTSTAFALSIILFLQSCTKDEETLSGADVADVTSESLADAYFEDVDDMTMSAVEGPSNAGGRINTEEDDRFCAGVTKEGNTVTIDFGDGCVDPKGNVRKGKINITYIGTPGEIGFATEATFDGYSINSIELEGTRFVERVTPSAEGLVKHEIELTAGKVTWPDGKVATRESNFVREWDPEAGVVMLEGDAEGTNRNGLDYTMEITTPLVFKKECIVEDGIVMAVEGTKVFRANRDLIIDYGDGSCDKTVTATVGTFSRSVTVGDK